MRPPGPPAPPLWARTLERTCVTDQVQEHGYSLQAVDILPDYQRASSIMRSLDQARQCWPELQRYASLRDLKDAVRLDATTSLATNGLRSACWKAFLLLDTVDVAEWQKTLAASRSAYNSLKSHFFRYIDNPDDVGTGHDPLSQETEVRQNRHRVAHSVHLTAAKV